MPKKNKVSIFGKRFHITRSGSVLPAGNRSNFFTKCMSKETTGKMKKGVNLDIKELAANQKTFFDAKVTCYKQIHEIGVKSHASKLKIARGITQSTTFKGGTSSTKS